MMFLAQNRSNIAKICLKFIKIDDFSPKIDDFRHQKKTLFHEKMMFFDIFYRQIFHEISEDFHEIHHLSINFEDIYEKYFIKYLEKHQKI